MGLSSSSASAADSISGAGIAGRCVSVCARHIDAHNIRVRACKRSEQGHLDQGRRALGDACWYSLYLLYWYNSANTDALSDDASAASKAILIRGGVHLETLKGEESNSTLTLLSLY